MKNNYSVTYNKIRKTKLLHITIFSKQSKNKLKKHQLKREQIRRFMKNRVWMQICGLEERARIRQQCRRRISWLMKF